jgi:DNA-binding CsgD family transcriptional regulator
MTLGEIWMTPLSNAAEVALAEAIRRCGAAGFEAALWAFLQRACAADNLVVLACDRAGPPLALYRQTSEPRAFAGLDATYLAGAYLLDPIHGLHVAGAPAGVYRLSDVAPDAFHRSRYFTEYFRQTTILDEIDFLCWPRPGVSVALSLGRDASSGTPYSARDLAACRRIAPVVVALAERHWAGIAVAAVEPPDVVTRLAGSLRSRHGIRLSPRQTEVALMILRGHSTLSIALQLRVSPQTVKVFRRQLYRRCGINSQAELFWLMLPLLGVAA